MHLLVLLFVCCLFMYKCFSLLLSFLFLHGSFHLSNQMNCISLWYFVFGFSFWHAVVFFAWACCCLLYLSIGTSFLFFPCLCMISFHCSLFLLGMLLSFLFILCFFFLSFACLCMIVFHCGFLYFVYHLGMQLSFLFLHDSFHLSNQKNCISLWFS